MEFHPVAARIQVSLPESSLPMCLSASSLYGPSSVAFNFLGGLFSLMCLGYLEVMVSHYSRDIWRFLMVTPPVLRGCQPHDTVLSFEDRVYVVVPFEVYI